MSNSSAAIAVGPFVAALEPYIVSAVGAAIAGLISFGVALFTRWTGVTVQAAYAASLRQAAQTEAGVLIAEASDNLSSKSISVTSPAVAAAAQRIAAALPEAMQAVGMTPDALSRLVAGEIGKLQAQTLAVSAPPATPQTSAS